MREKAESLQVMGANIGAPILPLKASFVASSLCSASEGKCVFYLLCGCFTPYHIERFVIFFKFVNFTSHYFEFNDAVHCFRITRKEKEE